MSRGILGDEYQFTYKFAFEFSKIVKRFLFVSSSFEFEVFIPHKRTGSLISKKTLQRSSTSRPLLRLLERTV